MKRIHCMINGCSVDVPEGITILDAAERNGIQIPTLCHFKDLAPGGNCRMCVVEVKGARTLLPACRTTVSECMEICTDSEAVVASRKTTLDLICRRHRMECEYCSRYSDCELHKLLTLHGMDDQVYMRLWHPEETMQISETLIKDHAKCIKCRRCIAACQAQTLDVFAILGRGANVKIAPADAENSGCINCGACVQACPTGALSIVDETMGIWNALRIHKKHLVAVLSKPACDQAAAVLKSAAGDDTMGKFAAILKKIGFGAVYSSECGVLPQGNSGISSNYSAVVQLVKKHYPDLVAELSWIPSQLESAARLCRSDAAEKLDCEKKDIYVVAVSTDPAAKAERQFADLCITPGELVSFVRRACVSKYTANLVYKQTAAVALDEPAGYEYNQSQASDSQQTPDLSSFIQTLRHYKPSRKWTDKT